MRRSLMRSLVLLAAILACEAAQSDQQDAGARTIALTFDDATRGDGPFFSGEERTQRLVDALTKAGVDEAMFFVTTNNVAKAGESGTARLQVYTDAGHTLANHSHSHQWLWRTDTDAYIADLDEAIERLGHIVRAAISA